MTNVRLLEEELARVKKRLDRERRTRLEAETISERVTRELYDRQKELELFQAIAVIANEATSIDDAMGKALAQICAYTQWPIGHLYLTRAAAPARIFPTNVWHLASGERFAAFRQITEELPFDLGVGLPGRVLASQKSLWVTDLTLDGNFPRAQVAQANGLRSGFAVPIMIGSHGSGAGCRCPWRCPPVAACRST